MLTNPELPETMRAAQGKDYGPIDEMISVGGGVKVPHLSDLPEKKRAKFMVLKIHAVSLAPGDCRVLSGLTKELQGPPSFPYIPGGDCCGIVVELPENAEALNIPFRVGDRVAARFAVEGPRGALGEYALVSSLVADKAPQDLSSVGAAALASASPAVLLADRIQNGERVLVLGAGGGVGSHLCQLLRSNGASYIVGVSSNPQRLLESPISCDKAIDYTKQDPFSVEEFQKDPFDVVFDLASGGWPRLLQNIERGVPLIVKPASLGGRYITTTPDNPHFEIHSTWAALQVFLFPTLWRALVSRSWSRSKLPSYTYALELPTDRPVMTRTMELARQGTLKPVMDPSGPFPFTADGVRAAFSTQKSRHPQGKVVVHVSDP
jgi:NADPH:quinone reductase-like Zn-dependent oxidoreductase